ncbi:putative endopolygalacturonase D [Cytospora mali]|uniref:Endopolygalacturonase D n=1 Tax=Cytospora mali TaxID=578113 RepID=A0A194VJF0_CYTMA|nr:putative endopolygalacturonase D [Valsa mali]
MDAPFAILKPANVLAKVAFDDGYKAISHRQRDPGDEYTAVHNMHVESEPKFYRDVIQFRRAEAQPEGDGCEDLTEPGTDSENDLRELGSIWTGHYILHLSHRPSTPEMGWIAGKGPTEKGPYADIFLCTRSFAKRYSLKLRSFHFRFNFDRQKRSLVHSVTVNDVEVGRQIHSLNQYSMKIRVGLLEYDFQYTNASPVAFFEHRREYIATALRAPTSIVFDMPTPCLNARTIGQWTLGERLGSDTAGKVFLGSNSKNEIVAVKIMLKSASSVDEEIGTYQAMLALAEHDDNKRIVRLKETIDPRIIISGITFIDVTGTVDSDAYDYYILCGDGSCSDFTFDDVDITGGLLSCNYPSSLCLE